MNKKLFPISTLLFMLSGSCLAATVENPLVGFSPNGDALNIVLYGIEGAQASIDVAAYSFTSKPIAVALIEAKNRGVKVRVVADMKANQDKYTAVNFLANQGVAVRLNNRYAIMHNKYMVVDGHNVQTGSFNYTSSAAKRNAENVILLKNAPATAKTYQQDFERLYAEADTLKPY
ncbi:TPA: phospholipase D family protein [Yersinia enterocolitica]|nr:phospholipase D family protein [Yersinia enterocolitica]